MITEYIAETISVHPKTCIGCREYKADIMISFSQDGVVHDVFFSQSLAEELLDLLASKITQNKQSEKTTIQKTL